MPPPAPGSSHHHRPVSLNSVKGSGKRTSHHWLLCYRVGGGAPSASPSPPSEPGDSQCSTPSPTDHGFKLPNSFSNERPTSLPVALLNCSGGVAPDHAHNDPVVPRGVVGEFLLRTVPARFTLLPPLPSCVLSMVHFRFIRHEASFFIPHGTYLEFSLKYVVIYSVNKVLNV